MMTLDIQLRLSALGHNPGPLDGIRGRRTITAIKAFQAQAGIAADGLAGAETLSRLFGAERAVVTAGSASEQTRPWLAEAQRLLGTREAAGTRNNPLLLEWARALGLAYQHDSVAWCGLFAAHCIAASLPEEPLPTNPLGARNWLKFGVSCAPRSGAVLVFWRGTKTSWSGHVGFQAGEDAEAFHVLGGNQADAVTVTRIARTRLLGARWPITAPLGGPAKAIRIDPAASPALSTNEA